MARSGSELDWLDPDPLPVDPAGLGLHKDPLIAELLYRRGLRDAASADDFVSIKPRPAPEPDLLPGMDAATGRVCHALEAGERIAVYGDYDADGVTATALLALALRAAAPDPAQVTTRLPTRSEGYGLNPEAVDALAADGVRLLLAVDCGSTDHANVARARAAGMDVVVLDHHQMADGGPEGATVVSAQLGGPGGPGRELAAVGVAYLLVSALARAGCPVGGEDGTSASGLLDLVALGTVGDVAPLTGLNRALVRDGLRRIRERPRPGVAALCARAKLEPKYVTADAVAFKLVPRLNAAGRMGDPALALRLLLAEDPAEGAALAAGLDDLNARRRAESGRIVAEAEAILRGKPGWEAAPVLVVPGRDWGAGVLGIAASQLAERYGKPVVVLSDDGEVSRGSARSVPGFDIAGALTACGDLLRHHGGHSQAAGLSLASDRVADLTSALADRLAAAAIPPPTRALQIEADLPAERLTLATARLVGQLGPFGTGNEAPLLRVRGAKVRAYTKFGADKSHLKIAVETGRGVAQVLMWGAADRSRELLYGPPVDIVLTIGVDHWDGTARLHAEAKDFRAAVG